MPPMHRLMRSCRRPARSARRPPAALGASPTTSSSLGRPTRTFLTPEAGRKASERLKHWGEPQHECSAHKPMLPAERLGQAACFIGTTRAHQRGSSAKPPAAGCGCASPSSDCKRHCTCSAGGRSPQRSKSTRASPCRWHFPETLTATHKEVATGSSASLFLSMRQREARQLRDEAGGRGSSLDFDATTLRRKSS